MNESAMQSIVEAVVSKIKPRDMTLDIAQALAQKVREKAEQMGVKAVVAISNRAACTVLVESMDDAFTVVSLKMSTSTLKPLAQPGGSLYGIQFTNNGKIVIFGGGEPLKNSSGEIIGGIGVSGGSEKQDTALAAYGKEIFEKGQYL